MSGCRDNALYRHPDLRELRDLSEEDPLEVEASKFSLNYIRLDGNIGCMVNGAGLAMATMDIIKLAGGEPANFLDVGGCANAEQIKNAFRILMADKNVKAVFINIFGGILRCDVLAAGVIAAVRELGVPVPIVIRMEGTNVEEGKRMLRQSGLNFTTADSMSEGANAEQIKNAFRILMADKNVKAVLINIFGGILRCDVLAVGVIAAVKELGVRVPIVIRMEGTNVEEGKRMLHESGLNFTTADSMGEAAERVVRLAK